MRRPLVYRTLDVLADRELTQTAGTEASTAGPAAHAARGHPRRRRQVADWLESPVEHVRDARSELMLKLLFLDRRGLAPDALLEAQRERFREQERELRTRSTQPTASRARLRSGGSRTPPPRCASSTRCTPDRDRGGSSRQHPRHLRRRPRRAVAQRPALAALPRPTPMPRRRPHLRSRERARRRPARLRERLQARLAHRPGDREQAGPPEAKAFAADFATS